MKIIGTLVGAVLALASLGIVQPAEAAPSITLSYSTRIESGVSWVDYHAVSDKNISPKVDWAVVQTCNGVSTGSRLYHTTNRTGDAYLDAPSGASCTAYVVELANGQFAGQPAISNTVAFVNP